MRILDQNGAELQIENIDQALGRLVEEKLFIAHHEAVDAIKEEGHWVTVAEYPNGGKDVEWIVDVAGAEAVEAWDEYEDIYRYVPYTDDELASIAEAEANDPERRLEQLEEALELLLSGVTK